MGKISGRKLRVSTVVLLALSFVFALSCTDATEAQRGTDNTDARFRGWRTNTAKRSVELDEFTSGGPPKDGIPSVDRPVFVSVENARRWLRDNEPVIALEVEGEARAYPLQILIWHEI